MKSILSKFVFPLAFALVSFYVGYGLGGRIGDSRGYDSGFKDGYRYDCREEIANLYDQVKELNKAQFYLKEQVRSMYREKDSLAFELSREALRKRGSERADWSYSQLDSAKKAQMSPEIRETLKHLTSGSEP